MQFIQLFILITAVKSFTFGIAFGFIAMAFLLLCSAVFSGSEIAFFSLSPAQLNEIKSMNNKAGKTIIRLLEKPKRLLATILIANNFVNIAIVIISTFIMLQLFDFTGNPVSGFVIQVVLVTFLILLIGEIMPKIYTTHNAVKFALFIAQPMVFLIKAFYPFSSLLIRSTSVIDKRISRKGRNLSINELSNALEITTGKDTPEDDRKILKGIVKFSNIDVKEIMKSRVDVTAVDIETDFSQLIKIIQESGYSRIPVYKENFDNIAGVLYIKDILPYLDQKSDFRWQKLIRFPFFVPESKKINDLLEEFREKKIHLAVVVDEYGGTSGILTLEDIMEEIVGEINDEFDTEDIVYSKFDENNYVFEGKTLLNDFYKIINLDPNFFDPVKGDSDTLAGLILELEGKIPEKNDCIVYRNFVFTIEAADKRSIKRIKVAIHGKPEKKPDEEV